MENVPAPSHPFRWFPEFWDLGRRRLRPQARMLGLALLVGILSGFGAIVFYSACQTVVHFVLDMGVGYHPQTPGGEPILFAETDQAFRPWLLLLLPALGGLISGLIVFTLAPEAEGHGTDAVIAAYHFQRGYIRPRVPLVKILASALTIGSGGSGGREGPIAQIGAGIGSYLGGIFRLRSQERRVLMAAGMGAGVAAIFRAPLAGALFAAEVLYRSPDFESEVVIPAALASISAYCTFGLFFGWDALFTIPDEVLKLYTFNNPLHLVSYSLLAIFMVILAMLYTRSFYGLTYLFRRLQLPRQFKPMIGALASALVGLCLYYFFFGEQQVFAVLSFGYGILQTSLALPAGTEGDLHFALILLAIAIGKILTTGLTIGSGGSGGVFGPSMVIGGCGGGALGIFLHRMWPALAPHPSTFVIVGMAGFFAAAAKTPFSTLVIVSELTGNYGLLLPTLWVCAVAFLLSDEQSIYSSQLESRSRSPAHQGDYLREVIAGLSVREFLIPNSEPSCLHPNDRLPHIMERLSESTYLSLPVIDEDKRLIGVVTLEEVHFVSRAAHLGDLVVAADMMHSDIVPLRPDDRLDRALELFVESNLLELPVVNGTGENKLIGIVRRTDVSSAYLRRVSAPQVFAAGDKSDF